MKENTKGPSQFGLGKNMGPMILAMVALCGVSFYLGGAYYAIPENSDGSSVMDRSGCIPLQKVEAFPVCNITTQDMTPCQDPKVSAVTRPQCSLSPRLDAIAVVHFRYNFFF